MPSRHTRVPSKALGVAAAGAVLASLLTAAPSHAADPWDPYGEGLKNTNKEMGYPAFVNSGQAIPATNATYDPTKPYLAEVYAADLAAGAGSAPGKDFWIDRMLARNGVQPDEAGGMDYSTDAAQNIDYDNNVVLFTRGRALYMEDSTPGLGFQGDVAYIDSLGNRAAYTLTASVNGTNITLAENQAKRHNAPSYFSTEFTGGGLKVTQTKWISQENLLVEWLQVTTTDGSTKTVALTASSSFATTVNGNELRGSVTAPNNVTQVATRLAGDGFAPSGSTLTRTISASPNTTDVKLQMGFTTSEIPASTTDFEKTLTRSAADAYSEQARTYNTWWVENIPYVHTESPEIDKTVFYKWWLLRANFLDANIPGNDYQFPTSIEGVFGSAYNNAIVLTAGMFIEDMKYFRDPSSAYGTWLSAGEVARQNRYIDNPGNPRNWNSSYANYISEAAWDSYAVHGGDSSIARKLAEYAEDDVAGQLSAFDSNKNNLIEYASPAMTGNDVDAVSFSWRGPAAWESYPMDRPETAYLYSGALAAAEGYRQAGDTAGAERMDKKASDIKSAVLKVMWEDKRSTKDESGLYGNQLKAAYSNNASGLPAGSKIPWKEVNMYYPYTVGLMPKPGDQDFDQKYLDAFRLFVDSDQYSPFPFYTANQADAKARAARDANSGRHYSNNFSTINATVMFRLLSSTLRDYPNSYLTSDYYKKLLYWSAWAMYEKGDVTRQNENEFWAHGSAANGGSIKYRSWIHQTQLGTTNFTVLEDVVGLQPRADDILELSPIDVDWDHFTANNLKYHGKDLTIVWDEPGGAKHYGNTPEGYSAYLDGTRVFTVDKLVPVQYDPATGTVTTDAKVTYSQGADASTASEVRFAANDRVVDLLAKAGVDVDPATSAARNVAAGAKVAASFSTSGSTGAGNTYQPAGAVDSSTTNEPFWGTAGSPNATDWLEVDLGTTRTLNEARLFFYRTSSSTTIAGYAAPASYAVQYWDGAAWKPVTAQARTPLRPTGNLNTVRFADVQTSKVRINVAHQAGSKTGIKEVQLRQVDTTYTPSDNAAPTVTIDRIAQADPTRASFVGSVADDGLPNGEVSQKWEVSAKPEGATVTFSDASSATTRASFSQPGKYTLVFTASDGEKSTSVEQVIDVSDARPLGPDIGRSATPTATFTAAWNRIGALNNGEIVKTASTDQTKLWGSWNESRPAQQSVTYTWPQAVRVAGASASFWRDAAQGSGTGVAIPKSWKIEYLDGGAWKPVALRAGSSYPTNDIGVASEVGFTPVHTTAVRATFDASPNAAGTAYSAVALSELDVFSDYPTSYEPIAKKTAVNTPTTLPSSAWVVYPNNKRGQLPVTWDAIPSASFATPGVITVNGRFTDSELPVTGTISVGDSGSDISSVEPQSVVTFVGEAPDLPRTAVAVFAGGTGARESRTVTWDTVPASAYATAGSFVVEGTLQGTTTRARATVSVEWDPAKVSTPAAPEAPTATVAGDSVDLVWKAPSDGGAPITGYIVTVTPAGKPAVTYPSSSANLQVKSLVPGVYSASVVATNARGSSPASAVTEFTIPERAALGLTVTASTRCVAGKVVVVTTVTNPNAVSLTGNVTTSYGAKALSIAPGKSASISFATRASSVAAGEVEVVASGDVNGTKQDVTRKASYTAGSCN